MVAALLRATNSGECCSRFLSLRLGSIRSAALDAGAYGVEISGAGLRGSLVAFVDGIEDEQRIVEAAGAAGAKRGCMFTDGQAGRIEQGKELPDS